MQYEINGESLKLRLIYVGVLEFIVEEGVVEFFFYVWYNVGFLDLEYLLKNIYRGIFEVRVCYVRFLKGIYVKLQLEGGDFVDVFNYKVVLEIEFRQYVLLIEGDLFIVYYGGVDYGL